MIRFLFVILSSFALLVPDGSAAGGPVLPMLPMDAEQAKAVYSGKEEMHYVVSWSGGIKIGDLFLTTTLLENQDSLAIRARVKDYGLFRLFYPVDDSFVTLVGGSLKLPYRYEVEQHEGHSSSTTHRLTLYDQDNLQVRYQKNKEPWKEFTLSGPAYNEFSSFFITRALNFTGKHPVVPTFVDEKRHEVVVTLLAREKKKSIFGKVDTIKVMPKMDFKGLYDKDGDTVFWLTDDICRIPVVIQSKILVGSLVAELVSYNNPACPQWTGRTRTKSKQNIELGD